MDMTLPVKSIDEIEVKSGVSASDKILILDSVSEEARLASKTELKWDKWDAWPQWPQGTKWDKGDKWDKWDKGDTWSQWATWPQGADWKDGKDWADWNWIASITSSKSWKITTVTITETNWDSESFEISDGADWGGGSGDWDVKWPDSATDWHLAVFDWATGKLIKDWGSVPSYSASDFDIKDLTDSTSLRTTWSWKQDTIVAWTNIQIANDWKTISATDTTYSATDFDIKDLTDSTNLRTTWSGKQDALSTQTAYTSKWTATKVPTITTNTLWQVTTITETSITFPVTSVNGNTWAVTVSEFTASNWWTKVFTYPTTSVEDIVTWCNGWWTAILMKSDWPYVVSKVGTGYITSVRDISWDWWTFGTWSVRVDMLTYDNTYALTSSNNVVTYNHFHPWWTATIWYVVTKTASGYEWAAPSGWDVVVSSDSDNVLTTWAGLRAGDESDLPASPDSNTLYFCY